MQDHPLYRSDSVRELDRLTIASGVAAIELMRRAGWAAFNWLQRRYPEARRICVLCGPGNNGGDGYVVARLAREAGLEVQLAALAEPRSDEARAVAAEWQRIGGSSRSRLPDDLDRADLIVDALFGIGIQSALREPAASWVRAVNDSGRPVLALDVPSGLDADRGCAVGAAVQADSTISFVGRKQGLYTGRGRALAGERQFDDLGAGSAAQSGISASAIAIDRRSLSAALPKRADDAHKGAAGHVLALGGDLGMGGAIRLAAEAALRCGAGLVSVATRPEHVGALLAGRPECMAHAVPEHEVPPADLLARATVLAIGPGLGRGGWGLSMLEAGLSAGKPSVLDADALWHVAQGARPPKRAVITPHPGEAARLLECSVEDIQSDRFAALRLLAERFRCVVLLKGNGSLIADGSTQDPTPSYVVDAGNPGLAVGGSGDVLTGVIAALLAQGLAPLQAARIGALLHATAGDVAAEQGQRGLLPSDLMSPLRQLINA
ncbi:NAD(P)H-hydrate dehydratase [Pseudomarimonas arenosa]|uniref:Bifunctional NAD(P)H-hydrate repair enzyme n=1 Tax=Pseudomarimonas arenosa TaxID=2774145 RepID=A0AAW3ZRB8_9GAMM|nr:NAD(P)H-hydrate dehydratase [Pseudomarimonas arenosa]MBD8526796.1 NAD(P)H-hydrate dehydratase [Pseudomarimonas arenosa]